jgi:hypothetical protein
MNRTFKATVAALMLAVSFAGSVAAGPFEDAAAAYRKGDYATALELIRPLAEEGNVAAQQKQKRGESSGYCRRAVDASADRRSPEAGPRVEAEIGRRDGSGLPAPGLIEQLRANPLLRQDIFSERERCDQIVSR